jgi:hypothetical protein
MQATLRRHGRRTTQLVQAEEDGKKLNNEELTANIILLFGAGHKTTQPNRQRPFEVASQSRPARPAEGQPVAHHHAIEEPALRFLDPDDRCASR